MLYTLPACQSLNCYLGYQRQREHIQYVTIDFITVRCYNWSILLLVIAINLWLCLIYKWNLIIGMPGEENPVYIRFSTICSFKHHWGSWNISPVYKGRYCAGGQGFAVSQWERQPCSQASCCPARSYLPVGKKTGIVQSSQFPTTPFLFAPDGCKHCPGG